MNHPQHPRRHHNPNHTRFRPSGQQPASGAFNAKRTLESAGPDGKVRGTAQQIYEKYLSQARDAHTSGDRVLSENCLQHAEHYLRLMNGPRRTNGEPLPEEPFEEDRFADLRRERVEAQQQPQPQQPPHQPQQQPHHYQPAQPALAPVLSSERTTGEAPHQTQQQGQHQPARPNFIPRMSAEAREAARFERAARREAPAPYAGDDASNDPAAAAVVSAALPFHRRPLPSIPPRAPEPPQPSMLDTAPEAPAAAPAPDLTAVEKPVRRRRRKAEPEA